MRHLLQLSKEPWLDVDADNEYKEHIRDIQSCIKTMNKKGEGSSEASLGPVLIVLWGIGSNIILTLLL